LMKFESASVKACVFDTFGTVVDWRSSVIAEATNWGRIKGLDINRVEFTDRWRLGYGPAMDRAMWARFRGPISTISIA
jgi:2-haloacid dehalogenase